MSSQAAKGVAKEVLEIIGKGKKPNISKIAPKHGYAQSTADSGQVQKTKTYQKELKPLVDRLVDERDAIITRLQKTRGKAKYRDLIDGLDKVTKVHQLLTGGKTENLGLEDLKESLKAISGKR